MKIGYLVYGALGIVLSGALAATAGKGLSEVNRKAYETYIGEGEKLSDLGFKWYRPEEIKVRFFDGDKDYVSRPDGEFQKEAPVLDVLAGTAWQVGEEYQVVVPVYEKLSGMTELLGGANMLSDEEEEMNYSETMYVATIAHEAFHCWQFSRFEEQITKDLPEEGMDRETIITEEIDSHEELKASVLREAKLWQEAYAEEDRASKLELIKEALKEAQERNENMSQVARTAEYFVETLEGSAQYVEACTYRNLTSEEEYNDYYMGEFEYHNGSGKYYTLGLYQCLVLDQVAEGWQQEFTYENNASTILANVVR